MANTAAMIVLWILLIIVLLLLVIASGLLFSPFSLIIDTDRGIYTIRVGGVGVASIVPAWETDELLYIRWRLWLWKREYHPVQQLLEGKLPKKKKNPKKKRSRSHKKRKSSRSSFFRFAKIQAVLRSFRVHDFQLQLDTTDPVWNAYLIPIVGFFDPWQERFSINFEHRNALRLKISNRMIHVLRAWIFA